MPSKIVIICQAGLSEPGVPWYPQILADQVTLSQPGGGADYAHHITTALPRILRPSYGPAKANLQGQF